MKERLENPTVLRILDAAERVFAEHGYAGARVDDIAQAASMAKSHVYYHCESKEQILRELIDWRVGQILAAKQAALASLPVPESFTPDTVAGLTTTLVGLLEPHEAFVRVLLLQSIGTASTDPPLFRALEPFLADTLDRLRAAGYEPPACAADDLYHFALVPLAMELALGERRARASGVDPRTARAAFLDRLLTLEQAWLASLPRKENRDGRT